MSIFIFLYFIIIIIISLDFIGGFFSFLFWEGGRGLVFLPKYIEYTVMYIEC